MRPIPFCKVYSWPDTPAMTELGYDVFNENVFLFAALKGTPKPIIDKLDGAFHQSMADPDFITVMRRVEFKPAYRKSAGTRKYLEDAYARIGHMIREQEPAGKK